VKIHDFTKHYIDVFRLSGLMTDGRSMHRNAEEYTKCHIIHTSIRNIGGAVASYIAVHGFTIL